MGLRRVDAEPEAHRLELARPQHRRLAALEDIDERRPGDAASDDAQFIHGLRRLDKPDIGAGLEIGVDPVDRGIEALDRARIRAGDDHHQGIPPGIDGGLDLADHLSPRDHLLAVVMPAFLGADLVFEVEGGDPGLFIFAHRADHVERVAIAGIGVGDDRDLDRLDGAADEAHILAKRQEPHIGIAVRPRIAAARQIDRPKPGLFDEPRRQSIVGPRHHRIAGPRNEVPHGLACVHQGLRISAWFADRDC